MDPNQKNLQTKEIPTNKKYKKNGLSGPSLLQVHCSAALFYVPSGSSLKFRQANDS